MIDEATRWTCASFVVSRTPNDILGCITRNWIRIFGAPRFLISDREGALGSEEASVWFERWQIEPRLKAKGSHASVVERHHEILRQQLHKISSQLRLEGLQCDVEEL